MIDMINFTSVAEPQKVVLFFSFSEVWFSLLLTYLAAYIFHEMGHMITAERFNLKPSFKNFGVETDIDGTKEQQIIVARGGILGGLIIIIGSFWFVSAWFLILIPLYLWGCRTDFKFIKRLKGELNVKKKK